MEAVFRRIHGEFKQGIQANVADFVVFERELGPDAGRHRGPPRSDRATDNDLAWLRTGRSAALDQVLQYVSIRLVDRRQNIRETEQVWKRRLLPDDLLPQPSGGEQDSDDEHPQTDNERPRKVQVKRKSQHAAQDHVGRGYLCVGQ